MLTFDEPVFEAEFRGKQMSVPLYDLLDTLNAIYREHYNAEHPDDWLGCVADYLGQPDNFGVKPSRTTAAEVYNAVVESVNAVKKKNLTSVGLRSGTESTPADGPSGESAHGSTTLADLMPSS